MKIEILGTGCAKCNQLEKDVYDTLAELGITADVTKVKDIKQIIAYKVMITPALVIDGKVRTAGKLPKKDELKKMLAEN